MNNQTPFVPKIPTKSTTVFTKFPTYEQMSEVDPKTGFTKALWLMEVGLLQPVATAVYA